MKKLSELFGRNKKATPAGESPVIPESGNFPAGMRVAIVDVGDTKWEVIYHQPEKSFSFRHLGDTLAKGPAFTMEEDHIADAVVQKGELLHPKKLEQIKGGAWLDGLHPGTYFSALDLDSPKDKHGSPTDYYILRYGDLIKFLLSAALGITVSADVPRTSQTNGEADGGRVGEQPSGGTADAAHEADQPRAEGARGGVDES
jgi:hypothetical protein